MFWLWNPLLTDLESLCPDASGIKTADIKKAFQNTGRPKNIEQYFGGGRAVPSALFFAL
jgi:hypothetical protein